MHGDCFHCVYQKRHTRKDNEMTKIMTPEALLSYEHLFQPMAPEGSGAEPQYSACLVFSKETDLGDLKKVVDDAGKAKWGDKYTSLKESDSLRLPFRTDSLKEKGYDDGSIYINVRSKQKPGIVSKFAGPDRKPKVITDPDEVYSGCKVRATLNVFAYDKAGNRGVSFRLNNVQKLDDGERLDGRLKAKDDFEAIDDKPADINDMLS